MRMPMPRGHRLPLVANDRALDRCDRAFDWSIQQPHYQTDRRRKLHASRQAKIKTGTADVVDDAIKTEWLILDIYAPHSGWERII